jgi:cell division septation protein DedD
MTPRDAERFKDKIEVSLDSKQIFFLFFGGAIVACLVFVLGVMVGRRLEGREKIARKATTSAASDPLAALDEMGADDEEPVPAPVHPPTMAADVPAPPAIAAPTPAPAPAPSPAPTPAPKPAADDTHYTLQISSFEDKVEADALVAKLEAAGLKPFVATSDVKGKGTFYRVRVGDYGSKGDASAAKADFEKKQHLIAYVTKI